MNPLSCAREPLRVDCSVCVCSCTQRSPQSATVRGHASYTPSPPDLTIRTIFAAIADAGEPSVHFTAAVHRPLSLEDRARYMQRREQRDLLARLIFSVVDAIPTFIIGIVYSITIVTESGQANNIKSCPTNC